MEAWRAMLRSEDSVPHTMTMPQRKMMMALTQNSRLLREGRRRCSHSTLRGGQKMRGL